MEAGAKTQEAKAGETKAADPKAKGGDEDLSMEEILQSIRRIIAEDDKEGKKPVAADNTKTNGSKTKGAESDVPGSDVLELTEMIKEDGTIESLKDKPAAAPAKEAAGDVLHKIDEALTPEKPMEKPPEPPAAKAEEKPAAPPEPPAAPEPAPADALLSDAAAAAAAESFKKLKSVEAEAPAHVATTPAPSFRDGTTVEDLVTEMLRPMMKAWLDANLPPIVERIVEREVKKLTK